MSTTHFVLIAMTGIHDDIASIAATAHESLEKTIDPVTWWDKVTALQFLKYVSHRHGFVDGPEGDCFSMAIETKGFDMAVMLECLKPFFEQVFSKYRFCVVTVMEQYPDDETRFYRVTAEGVSADVRPMYF